METSETTIVARERDDQGRIVESYPLEDVVAALERIEPAGTSEVSDELGCAYATAYQKLRLLEDEGRVTSRKVANARLWTLANELQDDE